MQKLVRVSDRGSVVLPCSTDYRLAGFGFVESLVALVIAGMACIALLTIAASVLKASRQNEIRDAMNYHAVDGMERIRQIASEDFENIPGSDGFYCIVDGDDCIDPDDEDAKFWFIGESRCSLDGNECEKLDISSGEAGDFFYREVRFEVGDGSSVRVNVTVGMLNSPESWEDSLREESQIVGFVAP